MTTRLFIILASVTMFFGGLFLSGQSPEPSSGQNDSDKSRASWTTSKMIGSPEPPLPYQSARAFPKLEFDHPLLLTYLPGAQRMVVATRGGQVFSFANSQDCPSADLMLDVAKDLKSYDRNTIRTSAIYGLTFDPQFSENRYCYVCYILHPKKGGKSLDDGTRVSRFEVTNTNPPRIDPASEKVLITWVEGGHNGGCLKFGPDGYLYISTGDATSPNPPDALNTGQDCSDLLSSILRIDVHPKDNKRSYAIPSDNPFVGRKDVRPEIWAFGFRNPWRMSFDRKSGDLWVGDVGWELWEMVYRVIKGGNYGWSVMEGRQPVQPDGKVGPTPILPPTLEFPHTEAASITGGFVYHGKRLPKLAGMYICGDYETRTIWGAKWDGQKITSRPVLAQTNERIVAFGEDEAGELYYLDFAPKGGIYHLVENQTTDNSHQKFPRKLSETGLFQDLKTLKPMPGVEPFTINVAQWQDHATAAHVVALPGTEPVRMFPQSRQLANSLYRGPAHFPINAVLAKTISMEMEKGTPTSTKKIETQILHFTGNAWNGYTYRWNDEQTDANLVDAAGATATFKVKDAAAPDGWRTHNWQFFGRGQCMQCHNPWAGHLLAFTPAQLDRMEDKDNQLAKFQAQGLVTLEKSGKNVPPAWQALANPHDTNQPLERRARSYLHVNCSHCHQFGAGGTTMIDLRQTQSLAGLNVLSAAPMQGHFGMENGKIVAPGDPFHSVLYYRMAVLGQGHMPHIGSEMVDKAGLQLMDQWIRQMPPQPLLEEKLANLRGNGNAIARQNVIDEFMQNTSQALVLARELGDGQLSQVIRQQIVQTASKQSNPQIRNLFEPYFPAALRVKRLGTNINAKELLALQGNAEAGKALVLANQAVQCLNCHQIGKQGKALGPNLSEIGKKWQRAQLLESMLYPSKTIEDQYRTQVVITNDGKSHSGVVVEKTAKEIVLRPANGMDIRIPLHAIEEILPQPISLMPEGILRDLTAQQAADLLAYLETLR